DPAAETLARNILEYISQRNTAPARKALYVGEAAGKSHLEAAGFAVASYDGATLSSNEVLVVAPGGPGQLDKDKITGWLNSGGTLLAVGLDQSEANAMLPLPLKFKTAEHISAFFQPSSVDSPFEGIGPA